MRVPTVSSFVRGDLVRVYGERGLAIAEEAVVVYSYAERYGSGDPESYSLLFRGRGEVSWFPSSQLTLVRNDLALLDQWRGEVDATAAQRSDLDWIFANGREVLRSGYRPSIQALADCLRLDDLWGPPRGKGVDLAANLVALGGLAWPYLLRGSKQRWLEFCEDVWLPGTKLVAGRWVV